MTQQIQKFNYATETVVRLTSSDENLQKLAQRLGDVNTERALLGQILQDPSVYDTLTLSAGDFSDFMCALFFHCISDLILNQEGLDAYKLHTHMMKQTVVAKRANANMEGWSSDDIYNQIAMVQALGSASKDTNALEQTILDNAVRIRTGSAYLYGLDAIADKSIPLHDAISKGGKAIDEALQRVMVKASDIGSVFERMMEGNETIDYLSTGYEGLDSEIIGFPTKQLTVVGGETGKGKTTFFINIAGAVSVNELTVLFVKETSDTEALQKLFMNYTGVPIESYAGAGLSEEEHERVMGASGQILKNKLVIVDDVRPFTPQNVMRRFRKIEREWGEPIKLCIVDGLYNSDHPDSSDLWERQVRVIEDYEAYAKDTESAFVLTAQLKKNTYMSLDTQNRPPDLDDFEGWNKTYHGVHNIFCMVYSLIERDIMKLYIIKQRSRSKQKWGHYHKFYIDPSRNRYVENLNETDPPFDNDVNNDDIPF